MHHFPLILDFVRWSLLVKHTDIWKKMIELFSFWKFIFLKMRKTWKNKIRKPKQRKDIPPPPPILFDDFLNIAVQNETYSKGVCRKFQMRSVSMHIQKNQLSKSLKNRIIICLLLYISCWTLFCSFIMEAQ